MNRAIEIVEVGPRDELQNEALLVSTIDKVELILCTAWRDHHAGADATLVGKRRPALQTVGAGNAEVCGTLGLDEKARADLASCSVI